MEKGVRPAAGDFRQAADFPHVQLDNLRAGGQVRDARIPGKADGQGFNAPAEQVVHRRHADGSERSVDDRAADRGLPSLCVHFPVLRFVCF